MSETIAAIATPRGAGGIAIVRISGDGAEEILKGIFRPAAPREAFESHRLMYGWATDGAGDALDEVMAVLMRAPSSYTREDVAEIQCHGGVIGAQAVLDRVLHLGARMAHPGEFTRRAFMNGRIDLTRAANLIRNNTYDAFTPLMVTAVVYLTLVVVMTRLLAAFERRLRESAR